MASSAAVAQHGEGAGEPDGPYLIYTAKHLKTFGSEPNDYDEHFKCMADIDLMGYEYDRAVIAPDTTNVTTSWRQGTYDGVPFTGGSGGNGHAIFRLRITGVSYLGLLGKPDYGAKTCRFAPGATDVYGVGDHVGSVVGRNSGMVIDCHSAGVVAGDSAVGGLISSKPGKVMDSSSRGPVDGDNTAGGLVGDNFYSGLVVQCCSHGTVSGRPTVGGLMGAL